MSQITILVVDDSATIRRLVDSTLSPVGYRVVLAASADEGVQQAQASRPDLILLDHQLPGTTGFEVCQKLVQLPEVARTPVVVSSTLRKKAYVEYTDLPNVVDMLPKPYTEELLKTTVANALDTGRLIVQSQSDGTAVPEVIQALDDADLAGTFETFSLREVLDFLNNAGKSGVLEVDVDHARVWFYVDEGRLQAVICTGVDPKEIVTTLPDSLRELAPMLNLTVGGRLCSEVDGLVELLDHKVLDPRLLRMVLRHQAAMLVWRCFRGSPKGFRFDARRVPPPLFGKLPLDVSLAALLVEAALRCDASELPEASAQASYAKKTIRGQNLDRAGLSAQHMKVLSAVSEPVSIEELAAQLKWDREEVRRVLYGLSLAELVEPQNQGEVRQVFALEPNQDAARSLRRALSGSERPMSIKVVRDRVALQLLLRRSRPDVLMLPLESKDDAKYVAALRKHLGEKAEGVTWIALAESADSALDLEKSPVRCAAVLHQPYERHEVASVLEHVVGNGAPNEGPSSQPEDPRQAELVEAGAS